MSVLENKREFAHFIAGMSDKHTSMVLEPWVYLDGFAPAYQLFPQPRTPYLPSLWTKPSNTRYTQGQVVAFSTTTAGKTEKSAF